MGVRVLTDGALHVAVLYDSVTGWAFGPLIGEGEDGIQPEGRAEAFLTWLSEDPRKLTSRELEEAWASFCATEHEEQP